MATALPLSDTFPQLERSADWVVASLRDGLAVGCLETLRVTLDLSMNRLAAVLSMRPSTISRRRMEGRLDRDESERAFRLARLVERSAQALGSVEAGVRWLKHPQYELCGVVPLDYTDTKTASARVVENLIGRIERGIPA